jgi:hypothetical protein
MNKICTTIEQSKKLLELGIDVDTADIYLYEGTDGNYYPEFPIERDYGDIPAWSLSALLELMPFHIIENNKRYGFYQRKGLNPQGETYCFEYKSNTGERLYKTNHLNNPIDAAFEMIVWLKKNVK